MTVTYADKLSRMPGYQAGVPAGQSSEEVAAGEIAQLASNESPMPPHPKVVEAIARAAASMNRYPDPAATLLRRRLAERYDSQPGNIAVGNGSCDLLLAAAAALCEPGDEILYAWPSFSMYPYLPALTEAREIRVPLAAGDVLDLDAMAVETTAATQLLIVCNPNNPTATHHPVGEIAAFLEKVPSRVTVILDEAYIEFQTNDDPDASLDLLKDFPNLVVLRTFSKCYGLAGLRVGYAIGSSNFRAAVDAVRQPFSVNALAQAAGAEAVLHQDDVLRRVESTVAERLLVEEGVRDLGLATSESQANFSWVDLGDLDEGAILAGLSAADIAVRAGAPLGDPGHIRVSYGTTAEDQRFLAALAPLVRSR
jgi:histidinol-phosphate aminotransferase